MWAPAGCRSSRPVLCAGARDIPGKAAARRACGGAVLRRLMAGAPHRPQSLQAALSGSPGGFARIPPGGESRGVASRRPRRPLQHPGGGAIADADALAVGDEAVASGGPPGVAAGGPTRASGEHQPGRLLPPGKERSRLTARRPIGWLTLAQPSIPSVPSSVRSPSTDV